MVTSGARTLGQHSFVPRACDYFHKQKQTPQPTAKAFLVRWISGVKIWSTKYTALGTLVTYVL